MKKTTRKSKAHRKKRRRGADSDYDFLSSEDSYASDWSGSFVVSDNSELSSDPSRSEDGSSSELSTTDNEGDLEVNMEKPWLVRNPVTQK
jgi:hypothetical protein